MITRPMLAVDAGDITKLRYPRIASAKLDGIRCLKLNGKALSRSFKPIPNEYVRYMIENSGLPNGVDGELVLRDGSPFNKVSSAIMSQEGSPDYVYKIFDYVVNGNIREPFIDRYHRLQDGLPLPRNFAEYLVHIVVDNSRELAEFEEAWISQGYEGVITRTIDSPYKCGRSTLKEQYMLKLKRFVDSEAIVIGWEEMERNTNPAFVGELGQTKRSHASEGKIGAKLVGALIVEDIKTHIVHKLGSGFTMDDRASLYEMAMQGAFEKDRGWVVTYKYQLHGVVEKPRSPIFKGIRHILDMV